MKKVYSLLLITLLFLLCSCGYTVKGIHQSTRDSIFGNGNKTVAITKIEDPSLISWINYYLTNQFHTEMNFRKLAKWEVSDKADYHIEILLHKFDTYASLSDEEDRTLLNSITIHMEVRVLDTHSNTTWSSGTLSHSEYFQNLSEEEAIRETLNELVYMAFNAFEDTF